MENKLARGVAPGAGLDALLTRVQNVRASGKGFTARCPAHSDKHNSLSFARGEDGRVLVKCHAGCEVQDIVRALGLTMRDLFADDLPPRGKGRGGSGSGKGAAGAGKVAPVRALKPEVSRAGANGRGTGGSLPPAQARGAGDAQGGDGLAVPHGQVSAGALSGDSEGGDGGAVLHGQASAGALAGAAEGVTDDALASASPMGYTPSASGAPGPVSAQAAGEGGAASGQVPAPRAEPRELEVTYPYRDEGGNLLYEVVRTRPKGFYQRRPDGRGGYVTGLGDARRVLYRLPELRAGLAEGRAALILEGEKDVHRVLPFEAVLEVVATTAPMGAGKWSEAYTQSLQGFKKVYICPDLDDAGQKHAETVRMALGEQCEVYVLDIAAACEGLRGRKGADVSDYLGEVGDTVVAMESLMATSDEYRFESILEYVATVFPRELIANREQRAIHTGFSSLDGLLGGRLHDGLYVIGSISSLGKSAFVGQMAEHIASQDIDVLFYTLEMSKQEMVARSVVRAMYRQNPYRDINVGHVLYNAVSKDALETAIAKMIDEFAAYINYVEGNFDCTVDRIRQQVAQHVLATGRRPVVFVDYLQILRAESGFYSDKQLVDNNVIELKRLSRDYQIPVIVISSFNRQSYSADASFSAFKESGAIEYSADFVMALQARGVGDILDSAGSDREFSQASRAVAKATRQAKMSSPRPIEAVVLKNRRGNAFARFNLNFYAAQNYFEEVPDAAEPKRPELMQRTFKSPKPRPRTFLSEDERDNPFLR